MSTNPSPRLLACDAMLPQPWRNGGGSTRELLAGPAGAPWQYRISVADINSNGAFSSYPGVERWFAVIEGAGVELRIHGASHSQGPDTAPLRFAGDAPVSCHLTQGPTRDLNLMLHHASGSMQSARANEPWVPNTTCCGLFATVAGTCQSEAGRVAVPRFNLLWFDQAPASLVFQDSGPSGQHLGYWLAVHLGEPAPC